MLTFTAIDQLFPGDRSPARPVTNRFFFGSAGSILATKALQRYYFFLAAFFGAAFAAFGAAFFFAAIEFLTPFHG
ncbi:hypothetical protein CLG94_02210 [Candidatus Methylomirabilis limnetica]|uniref:Uncharacterized protein n=1 Tax=Candidatus Methylomirabilis limnetica TaxID=2033718 RepID=A0A2T4U0B3_9BACT|nr:hypothetical protein [Candidatus Methylomirabilis limnetica]PTL36810.1 hypothetical protein CLG94_02210 [Candidatus Methylomirabilis limnetica]